MIGTLFPSVIGRTTRQSQGYRFPNLLSFAKVDTRLLRILVGSSRDPSLFPLRSPSTSRVDGRRGGRRSRSRGRKRSVCNPKVSKILLPRSTYFNRLQVPFFLIVNVEPYLYLTLKNLSSQAPTRLQTSVSEETTEVQYQVFHNLCLSGFYRETISEE